MTLEQLTCRESDDMQDYMLSNYLDIARHDIINYRQNCRRYFNHGPLKALMEARNNRNELSNVLGIIESHYSYAEKIFSHMNVWDWSSVPLWSNAKGQNHLKKIKNKIEQIAEHARNEKVHHIRKERMK